ncbi:hypothetical protein [Phocaeicola sp.]|uniref:hypothetical protein n=1 Tax=Phocaeicola sp. TaxID=2773926 RepID=UPI0023D59B89|nr:hypothetical protein [Phocaeicola sp.]MDE5677705.1 hypothetical protein [Phocaeicola sp.]
MENTSKTNSANEFDFSVDDTLSKDVRKPVEKQKTANPSVSTIQVQPQIPGDSAPFIVLCGPPSSGKSMVLKSLASYLYNSSGLGYTISANTTLLNTVKYQNDCEYFNSIIGDPDTRMPNTVDYLMADIVDKKGNVVAHFLEAPGEDFFSLTNVSQEPNIQFKSYLDKIAQITPDKQRKVVYIILLDLDSATSFRNDSSLRRKYEQKMVNLYNRYVLHHPSKIILLYNKVDIPQNGLWANSNGCSNPSAVIADAKRNYPNLFFTRKFLFWDIENYSFLPFCTGSYPDDGSSYTASGPAYPSNLWKEIIKLW